MDTDTDMNTDTDTNTVTDRDTDMNLLYLDANLDNILRVIVRFVLIYHASYQLALAFFSLLFANAKNLFSSCLLRNLLSRSAQGRECSNAGVMN